MNTVQRECERGKTSPSSSVRLVKLSSVPQMCCAALWEYPRRICTFSTAASLSFWWFIPGYNIQIVSIFLLNGDVLTKLSESVDARVAFRCCRFSEKCGTRWKWWGFASCLLGWEGTQLTSISYTLTACTSPSLCISGVSIEAIICYSKR